MVIYKYLINVTLLCCWVQTTMSGINDEFHTQETNADVARVIRSFLGGLLSHCSCTIDSL